MHHPIIFPHERRALAANGVLAASLVKPDFQPVLRLWFPATPLSWLLTHTVVEDDDLAYGLSVQGGDQPTYELGYWSLSAFERFAQGAHKRAFVAPLSFRFTLPSPGTSRLLCAVAHGASEPDPREGPPDESGRPQALPSRDVGLLPSPGREGLGAVASPIEPCCQDAGRIQEGRR